MLEIRRLQPLVVFSFQFVGADKAKRGMMLKKQKKSVNRHPPVLLNMARGKSRENQTTHILHDPCLSPVVGQEVARWDDDAEMARILEQLQLGVHGADAVHGREAELDVGGDVALHEGFLFWAKDLSVISLLLCVQ